VFKLFEHWFAPFHGLKVHRVPPISVKQELAPARPRWSGKELESLLRRRRNNARRVETDAIDLISRFGGQAYYEAEQLSKGFGASDRTRSHWARVKIEIARRHEIDLGLSGSVQWD
jgi:hypothetical protein